MSTKAAATLPIPWELQQARILRFALGVSVAAAVSFAFQWPLFFLAPALTVFLLAHPPPGSPGQAAWRLGVATLVSFALGLVFSHILLPYPLVYVTFLALALLRINYWVHLGGVRTHALLVLIAILLLPMMTLKYKNLASGMLLSLSFLASTGLATLAFLAATVLVPDPVGRGSELKSTHFTPRDPNEAKIAAIKSTLVVLPITVLFLSRGWESELLILIFVAIFSLSPQVDSSLAEGSKFVKANLIGGAATFLFYWLMVAVPEYHFFVVLMLLATLAFGSMIFSPGPLGGFMMPACIALMVLIGGSMTEHTGYMDNILIRIVFISLAAIYVVFALAVWERVIAGKQAGELTS
jgi:hypothetical protein